MARKIWNLMYVVGNPAMFTRITACADNPMPRAEALASAEKVANNGGCWRVWVENAETAGRIYESKAEKDHRAAAQAA